MTNSKIYTLDWVKHEAYLIWSYWNGSDEKFIDGNGEERTQEEAEAAHNLLESLREVGSLIEELKI